MLPFFTNLLILLIAARLLGELFERFKQPSMIGEIIAGIVLGPSLFGLISLTEDINVISELGVFLLVISAGLEINVDDIVRSIRGKNIYITILAFFIPFVLGLAVGAIFKLGVTSSIFIGLCISITALPISVRILMDLGILNTDIGKKILSAAIFEDVLALAFFGFILNARNTDMTFLSIAKTVGWSALKLAMFLVILAVAYFFSKKISKRHNYIENWLDRFLEILKGKESLFALFFVFVLIFATITETLGFHFIIGAFFAALLINKNIVGENNLNTIQTSTNGLSMGFLSPIFFASIGLEFNIISIKHIWLLLVVVIMSYFSKILGGFLGGRLAKLPSNASLSIGIGLNARGIMELVIANIAFKEGMINSELFSILVVMGVLTTITTPFMLKWSLRKK